jgi:hypothetical protein
LKLSLWDQQANIVPERGIGSKTVSFSNGHYVMNGKSVRDRHVP